MKIDGNQIKVGNILEINSKLWRVLKTQHTQPGKGGAYLQVEMKELKEGTKMNERFRSSETVERAVLDEREFQFLYKNNDNYAFMDPNTFDQIEISNDVISMDQSKYLNENELIKIQLYENKPVSIILPENIILEVDCWHWLIKLKIALSHSSFLAIKSISSIQIKSILLMESNTLGS